MGYTTTDKLSQDWESYRVQEKVGKDGSPTEQTTRIITLHKGRDIVKADGKLKDLEVELLSKGLEEKSLAPNTVKSKEMETIITDYNSKKNN